MFSLLFCSYIILNFFFFCLTSGYTLNVSNNVNVTLLSRRAKESNVFKNRIDDWMIKGGETSGINNHPWSVSVKVVTDTTVYGHPFIRRCTGSFIAGPRYFLTAARCLLAGTEFIRNFVTYNDILILFASNSRNEGMHEWAEIASFHIPIEYEGDLPHSTHDFAVIVSVKEIIQTKSIKPRSIITASDTNLLDAAIKDQHNCTVYGFGQDPDKFTDEVEKITQRLLPYDDCRIEAGAQAKTVAEKFHVCARKVGGGPCSGDEGGSLNCPTYFPQQITGIFSFNIAGCGSTAVYIRLDPHATWITQHLSSKSRSTKSKSITSLLSPHLGLILAVLFLEIIALKNYLN